jgi:class 3 adenylate cyclase
MRRRAVCARPLTARREPCVVPARSPSSCRSCASASTPGSASSAAVASRGRALDVAARVADVARPGEVLVTSTVHDLVAGSRIEFSDRGAVALPLPGASREWRLFGVTR